MGPSIWQRVAAVDGPLRRLGRALGIGRLLTRLGLGDRVLGLLPERRSPPAPGATQPGVLLVGHPYGVQAVGEYLRASAAALAAADVPFQIRNAFDWGEHLRDMHADFPFWDRLTRASPYGVNLVHVNANEMASARRHLGRDFFAGRYTIASWHWELSLFPDAWRSALDDVDELWASSRFMQQALAEVARVPVEWMPHPVEARAGSGLGRLALGLPERTYLFLTSFDFNSYIARKNPLGAIRAFQTAFPAEGGDHVALVVKTSGSAERPDDARVFRALPELKDSRIVVLDAVLDRRRMVALLEQCDCYVSLHRAEGFGRGLAEAMLLGKPVIATGYSGNMDFTNAHNACIVDYDLVPVGRDEYPHAHGQRWADPDVEQAASYMRRLVGDAAWAAELAMRGRDLVAAQHGVHAVGQRYRDRLQKLGFL